MKGNMEEYYWELTRRDGTKIEIPPEAVQTVKTRWDSKLPIHTKYSGSIPYSDIADFQPTTKRANQTLALEEVAQVFREPIDTADGIKARWVKKDVPHNKWEKYYAPSGYKRIGDQPGFVTVAFRVAVHNINRETTQYCTVDEVAILDNKDNN